MMAYCSIMTLLLAFFIILQAFAPVQHKGLFYAGKGSFVRALETFGLGGIWDRAGGRVAPGAVGPRYRSAEGQDDPSILRRIDAEREDAQRALEALEDQFDVQEPRYGVGWLVTLPTPFSYLDAEEEFGPEQEKFCQELAPRLQPLILARGFVIRIGAVLRGSDREELEQTRRALAAAQRVRQKLVDQMSPIVREAAATRFYSFCRRELPENGHVGPPATQLRVDIMLTKPYVRAFREQGAAESETSETS